MKLKQLLTNKKILIAVLAVLIALVVGIVIIISTSSLETGDKDTDIKTEQDDKDTDINDVDDKTDTDEEMNDSNKNNSTGLEVLKPNKIVPENSSNASGSWDGSTNSNQQTDEKNESDTEDKDKESEKDENILDDDINWGRIY